MPDLFDLVPTPGASPLFFILIAILAALALFVWRAVEALATAQPDNHEPEDPDPRESEPWLGGPSQGLRAASGLLLGLILGCLALALPTIALAQGVDAGPVPDGPPLDPAAQSALMTLGAQLIAALVGAGPAGWLPALAAGAQVLVSASKSQVFEPLFAARSWARPLVSVIGGLVLAVVGAVATGMPILPALIAGPMAGALAVGFRELFVAVAGTKTKDERSAGKAASEALKGSDAEVAAKVAAFKLELDRAAALPEEAARLKAMADLWNGKAVTP